MPEVGLSRTRFPCQISVGVYLPLQRSTSTVQSHHTEGVSRVSSRQIDSDRASEQALRNRSQGGSRGTTTPHQVVIIMFDCRTRKRVEAEALNISLSTVSTSLYPDPTTAPMLAARLMEKQVDMHCRQYLLILPGNRCSLLLLFSCVVSLAH